MDDIAIGRKEIKPSYQTLGEICIRLNCGPRRVKRLIKEGLPAVHVAGQYMMTEKRYLEWLDKKTMSRVNT